MIDKDYIFNIPKDHVQALLREVYPTPTNVWTQSIQEIGEFLQAYSKYVQHRGDLSDYQKQRESFVEEMTHVLVCFAMLAIQEGISQSEINEQIRKKAIDGVKYPFDVREHAPLDQVMKDLLNCSSERTPGKIDSEHSCFNCKTGEFGDWTMTCRPLLADVFYYLEQAYGKTDGADQK